MWPLAAVCWRSGRAYGLACGNETDRQPKYRSTWWRKFVFLEAEKGDDDADAITTRRYDRIIHKIILFITDLITATLC